MWLSKMVARRFLTMSLALLSNCAETVAGTQKGMYHHHVEERVGDHIVTVDALVLARPACHNPDSWHWGSDEECPTNILGSLSVTWAGKKLFVPISAFGDLALVRAETIAIEPQSGGFTLSIRGGDAALSWFAVLEFGGEVEREQPYIVRRIVRHGAFSDEVWEETRYKFHSSPVPVPRMQ